MFSSTKPYTAITVQIERLTSEQYEDNDLSGIVDLVEVIRLQASGPTEAARALRKKLKYGDVHRQLRALTILDGLIQNAGPRFQRAFADEPLLERLRVVATDPVSDPDVTAKCKILFGQWAVAYKDTPGMSRIASLYKQLPQRKKVRGSATDSKVLKESSEPASDSRRPSLVDTPSSSTATESNQRGRAGSLTTTTTKSSKSTKDKFRSSKPFNLDKEKPQLLQTLASSSMASTNLINALKRINREDHRVSADREVMTQVETCKQLRRQVLRYIQHVESEQWLGSLIHANEELVNALMAFEVLDKSVEDDSDSDNEWDGGNGDVEEEVRSGAGDKGIRRRSRSEAVVPTVGFAGLMLAADDRPARPPRPGGSKPVIMRPGGASGPSAASRTGAAVRTRGLNDNKGKQRARTDEDDGFDDDWDGQEEDDDEGDEDEDENDPFADRNAIRTPSEEREEVIWA